MLNCNYATWTDNYFAIELVHYPPGIQWGGTLNIKISYSWDNSNIAPWTKSNDGAKFVVLKKKKKLILNRPSHSKMFNFVTKSLL